MGLLDSVIGALADSQPPRLGEGGDLGGGSNAQSIRVGSACLPAEAVPAAWAR